MKKIVDYQVRLRINGWLAGYAENLTEALKAVLSRGAIPESSIEIEEVREVPQEKELALRRRPVEAEIVPLSDLYYALPDDYRKPALLDSLAEHYHRELACLWKVVQDERCLAGAIRLTTWRRAGSQWICEFRSLDWEAPVGRQGNWHGQNTSQWRNPDTGWRGHQGAIVFDERDGSISSHH